MKTKTVKQCHRCCGSGIEPHKYRASGQHIKTIRKRLDWLRQRTGDRKPEHVAYDRAEMAALLWALDKIEQLPKGGLTNE